MSSAAAEDELENLFDKIADAKQRELRAAPPGGAAESRPGDTGPIIATVARGDLYTRIGNLARQLHEALRALGADQIIIKAAREFPDARDRLSYIARVTEQAAHRVLAAVEVAQSNHSQLSAAADAIGARWERFFAHELGLEGFCDLARDTRLFITETRGKSVVMTAQLHEIMMAQDFQDLTGQVIQKLTRLVAEVESQLLRLLVEALPPEKQAGSGDELAGPAVAAEGQPEVVSDQAQADEVLRSLGF